jgi:serine/threonine protein kinase/Tfp pilus assembly protein PilF
LQGAALSLRGSGQPHQPIATESLPELGRLGDFQLVREVGRGGMGVVYEAEQISLGRRVALKVLPFAAALDSRQLQRFKNEAQAAACLHHAHIVPVFGVGCERGVHYYAMQYIDGQTLAAIIKNLRGGSEWGLAGLSTEPSDRRGAASSTTPPVEEQSTEHSAVVPGRFRAAALLGMQAANALEHAHQLGIVHRDIKPANLLVEAASPLALEGRGVEAEGFRLWVTDFGLAHCRQGQVGLTVTGDLVGTLRYMSPEQALAQPTGVDHRADIYSLGATLYEFLTLEPAFDGRNREELLRQITLEEPRPQRRVNKAIPLDLETIVQKSMAKNPAERYATARELANDLRRFYLDEPIVARRSTLLQRTRRWGRRHRPVMVSAAVALVAASTVLAGSVGWIIRDGAARQARMTAGAQAALDEAQRFLEEGLRPQAHAAAKRAEALLRDVAAKPALAERVKDLLRKLAEEDADIRLVASLEAIRVRQADVKDDRFVLGRSRAEYEHAFRTYGLRPEAMAPEAAAALLRRRPPSVRSTLLAALDHWSILARHERAPEAGWLKQVLSAADSDPWRRGVRAAREKNDRQEMEKLAREVDTASQPPEALFVLEMGLWQRGASGAALALLRRAQQAFPGDFWINHNLGIALRDGEPPQNEEAIRFLTAAVALRPESAGVRLNLGNSLAGARRLDEAILAYRQAIGLKPDFSKAYLRLGLALEEMGDLDAAVTACQSAVQFKPDYGDAYYTLGTLLLTTGRLDQAITVLRRAVELLPDHAESHCNLGLALQKQGDFAQALIAVERGHELGLRRNDWRYPSAEWVRVCRRLIELDGRLPAVLRREAQAADAAEWDEYARLCYDKRRYVAAARFFARAMTADRNPVGDPNFDPGYGAACTAALAGCGRGVDAGDLDVNELVRWRKRALHLLRADLDAYGKRLPSSDPKERRLIQERLRFWQTEPRLAGVRDATEVAQLPADEQQSCRQFWAEVQALLAIATAAESRESDSPMP